MAHYDGTVGSVWKNFEKRFAEGGVGGIISTTLNVNSRRKSPLEYPPISEDKYMPPLQRAITEIKATGCRYIVQIGDPGYATQTSLFAEAQDASSASPGFDLIFGYQNHHIPMDEEAISEAIASFGRAALRVKAVGADGLEVTASKGYIIHQFLSPATNRRNDGWGGSHEKRFRFLAEITKTVRQAVGPDFLFGVRLAAGDHLHLPVNLRWPVGIRGNGLAEALDHGRRLKELGIDFLHIDSGFGFPHPRVTPGHFPFEEIRLFMDSNRHLSGKANLRAKLFHALPDGLAQWLFGLGWKPVEGINQSAARTFRQEVGLPVIANGGFQRRSHIEAALAAGDCDLVAMGRALLANPDLPKVFAANQDAPERPCTRCNRCVGRTATSPLGCYDPSRFANVEEMEAQILALNRPDP
jgi:2,4-dienoyl-CoA reductase (NADPH2)